MIAPDADRCGPETKSLPLVTVDKAYGTPAPSTHPVVIERLRVDAAPRRAVILVDCTGQPSTPFAPTTPLAPTTPFAPITPITTDYLRVGRERVRCRRRRARLGSGDAARWSGASRMVLSSGGTAEGRVRARCEGWGEQGSARAGRRGPHSRSPPSGWPVAPGGARFAGHPAKLAEDPALCGDGSFLATSLRRHPPRGPAVGRVRLSSAPVHPLHKQRSVPPRWGRALRRALLVERRASARQRVSAEASEISMLGRLDRQLAGLRGKGARGRHRKWVFKGGIVGRALHEDETKAGPRRRR